MVQYKKLIQKINKINLKTKKFLVNEFTRF